MSALPTRKTITVNAPTLYPKQHEAIFDPRRHCFIEASTKAGKTLGCLVWQIQQCFKQPGEHWWVAPIFAQARIAYKRAKSMLPESVVVSANNSRQEIILINGSVWSFRGANKPDTLYGEDVYSVVIDEASRCKDMVWEAIRSTLTATRGPTRVIGNVKGRKNWFYKLARRAEQGHPGHAFYKLTAWDAVAGGVLARAEIEEARGDIPEDVFRELYLAEATEDGANPFGLSNIEALVNPNWKHGRATVWGIDLAKSVDWTFLVGLNDEGEVAQWHRFQKPWRDTIKFIHEAVGSSEALVDSTGVGDPVLEELQAKFNTNFEGFKFSSGSKQQLMEGLAMDIQGGAFSLPEDCLILNELMEFEYTHTGRGVKYSAPPGLHDDGVCALALARAKWRSRTVANAWWN
jgi:phage FluMu gp28-like protein